MIEMRDSDVIALVHAPSNHLAKNVQGVSNGTSKETGMQVGIGTGDFNLPVGEASQASSDAWHIGCNH